MKKSLLLMFLASALFFSFHESAEAQTKRKKIRPKQDKNKERTETSNLNGDHPPFVRRLPNGKNSLHDEPSIPTLSAEQERKLLTAIGAIPSFSRYIYSGCNDRAHALWLLLPADVKTYTAKVWLFSPSVTTLAFDDTLTVPSLGGESPKWGFHVALVYKTASGVRVLDSAIADWKRAPKTLDDWLRLVNTPYGTILTMLDPKLYLFYALADMDKTTDKLTNNALSTVVNNGQFFECVDACQTGGNIEEALARDDVAAKLAVEGGCSYLRDELRKPGKLLEKLKGSDAPAECSTWISSFKERRDYWKHLLWGAETAKSP